MEVDFGPAPVLKYPPPLWQRNTPTRSVLCLSACCSVEPELRPASLPDSFARADGADEETVGCAFGDPVSNRTLCALGAPSSPSRALSIPRRLDKNYTPAKLRSWPVPFLGALLAALIYSAGQVA